MVGNVAVVVVAAVALNASIAKGRDSDKHAWMPGDADADAEL
jgi:hypothetical protein